MVECMQKREARHRDGKTNKALQERKTEWLSFDSNVHGRHHINPVQAPPAIHYCMGVKGYVSGSVKSSSSVENASN